MSYMLLFFFGELREPFLCWLREPPMATAAESVVVSGLSQDAQYVLSSSRGSPLFLLQTAYLSVKASWDAVSHDWAVTNQPLLSSSFLSRCLCLRCTMWMLRSTAKCTRRAELTVPPPHSTSYPPLSFSLSFSHTRTGQREITFTC